MTTLPHPPARISRRRDRRQGLPALVATMTRAVDARTEPGLMRAAFEDMVRRLARVRSVHLRESGNRRQEERESDRESILFEVPAADPAKPGVLEATFDRGHRLGEWDVQMLSIAAQLGALVLELERCRSALSHPARPARREGTAPSPIVPASLVGSTPAMVELRSRIERVASTDFTVLVEGESGVGKELVARQIHELSTRRAGPFVAINCAALVETLVEAELFGIEERTATGVRGRRGKFEAADGGTLFLDEIADLSLSAQAKLLRTLQDFAVERVGGCGTQKVDLRIVAATNRSLSELVERRLFRPDLFYRLGGVEIGVPPLRQRRDDILELARYFLDRHRSHRRLRLSAAAAEALLSYDWPGNVRQLERLIERTVAMARSDVIELDDLPALVRTDHVAVLAPSSERNDTLRAWASRYVQLVVERCQGNKRKACRVLDISYHTLQSHLRYPIRGGEPPAADLIPPGMPGIDAGWPENAETVAQG